MKNTKIEWADHTFNPWMGCTKISPACDNCYAAVSAPARTQSIKWGAGQPRVRTSASNWQQPIRWEKNHQAFFAQHRRRQRVFCASLADVFDNAIEESWRLDLFWLIHCTPHLDWLLLTKRIGNAQSMMREAIIQLDPTGFWPMPLPNVLLGATICNQEEADRDIKKLLATPATKRFLSIEPMLGAIGLTDVPMPEGGHGHHEFSPIISGNSLRRADPNKASIDWVIVGGESGHNARPMHPDWVRSIRDQCAAAGVPFLFKQWGEWLPEYVSGVDVDLRTLKTNQRVAVGDGETNHVKFTKVGKEAAGRLLDGLEHNGFPL